MTSGLKIGALGSYIAAHTPALNNTNPVGSRRPALLFRYPSSSIRIQTRPCRQAFVNTSFGPRSRLPQFGSLFPSRSSYAFNARTSLLKSFSDLQLQQLRVLSLCGKRMDLQGEPSKQAGGLRGTSNAGRKSQVSAESHVSTSNRDSDTSRGDLWEMLADSHCHPQESPASIEHVPHLAAKYIAVMGTHKSDWAAVAKLCQDNPSRVIPCFGVHPWFCHLHALEEHDDSQGSAAIFESLLQGKDPEHVRVAAEALVARGQSPIPVHEWEPELRRLLRRALKPENCPPKVMLHSFGGSSDMIAGFTKIPKIGNRFYFSFSHVINKKGSSQKLVDCIRKVPDDRLLIESDVGSSQQIDQGLLDICQVVANIKDWTMDETAQTTFENFKRFYDGHTPDVQSHNEN